jgi:hypothetical protein
MKDFVDNWILSKRFQPMHDVPWGRLWYFVAAVFFLFSVIGYFNDLLEMGKMPYAIVLSVAAFSGLNAVLWIVVLARLPALFFYLLMAGQFLLGPAITSRRRINFPPWLRKAGSTSPRSPSWSRFSSPTQGL